MKQPKGILTILFITISLSTSIAIILTPPGSQILSRLSAKWSRRLTMCSRVELANFNKQETLDFAEVEEGGGLKIEEGDVGHNVDEVEKLKAANV